MEDRSVCMLYIDTRNVDIRSVDRCNVTGQTVLRDMTILLRSCGKIDLRSTA